MNSISSKKEKKLNKLRSGLPKGAVKKLAKEFGYTQVHIRYVLTGKRNNQNVIEAALVLAQKESKRLKQLDKMIDKLN